MAPNGYRIVSDDGRTGGRAAVPKIDTAAHRDLNGAKIIGRRRDWHGSRS
jgi:hypothetical protein